MYLKALKERDERIIRVESYYRFVEEIENGNCVLVPWCCDKECEEELKRRGGVEGEVGMDSNKDSKDISKDNTRDNKNNTSDNTRDNKRDDTRDNKNTRDNKDNTGDNKNNVLTTVPLGVKCMCIPYDNEDVSDKKCFNCNKSAKSLGLFGRSY
ncbi:hypothetical protein LUQ84_000750 [Hamiltosporidium tvaerminnensis]|nr:hypothetical protein LUQ84_000750 [Hamiltosporidium tvaerminnensis]